MARIGLRAVVSLGCIRLDMRISPHEAPSVPAASGLWHGSAYVQWFRWVAVRIYGGGPTKQNAPWQGRSILMAERQGFEPWLPGSPVKRFSRPPHSTALPPLREVKTNQLKWRRDGDLNPGYAFGVYTISNRAPSASSDIPPSQFERHACAQQIESIHHPP